MFNRDNLIGFLLLGFCAVVGAIMLRYIAIGETPQVDLPTPLAWTVGILFFGLLIFGFTRGSLMRRLRGGQGGPQWPNPQTGQKSLWDRLRGR